MARFARIAIGNPATVPVGRYARQALAAAGALGAIESRLVLSENARQLVALVARGEADAAIVYATDAASIGPSRITAIPAAPSASSTPKSSSSPSAPSR